MILRAVLKCTVACFVALAPALSHAAIPAQYFPSYSFRLYQNETQANDQYTDQYVVSNSQSIEHQQVVARPSRKPASINRAVLMVTTPSRVFYGENGKSISPDLIATFYQIRATEKPIDMSELIPMDMKPTDNSSEVFSRVADKSLNTFFKSPAVRDSSLGKTATAVEQKMKQEVVIGSDNPSGVQHKFNFNLQAFQALAQIQYTGITNAALKFKMAENKLALEVFEKIAGKEMVVSHTIANSVQTSEVSMRWSF